MSQIYVCLPLGDSEIIADLQLLTSRCDCDIIVADGAMAEALTKKELVGCSGILVVLKEPLTDLIASEPTIVAANKHGLKIFSIWPKRSQARALPQSLEKYSIALLPWDGEKICAALCKDVLEWSDADGGARSASKTKRNKC